MTGSTLLKNALLVMVSVPTIALGVPLAVSDNAAIEALYQQRLRDSIENGGYVKSYDPQEKVRGATARAPLVTAGANELSIANTALDRAEEYAKRNNSQAFMVWHKGKIQRASYFDGIDASTPLVTKSLSKPLTAVVVGRAIQLGFIASLDQPVADFITEWQGTNKAKILVRHLLDMHSGLLPQAYSPDPDSPLNRAYLSPVHGQYIVDHYPLVAEPGTEFGYNNATADLVAVLIERATAQRYADFLADEVLIKIGAPGGSQWVNRPGGTAHSGCCAYFPAETFLRIAIVLMHDGVLEGERFLPAGYVQQMITPSTGNPHYGLGVWIGGDYVKHRSFLGPRSKYGLVLHSEPFVAEDIFMFDGNSNQVVFIMPALDLVVLRMGPTPPREPEWDNSVLPNVVARGILPTAD